MDEMLVSAICYAIDGWAVFPLQPREKKPHPRTHGFWDATTDMARVAQLWEMFPGSNVGVATGASQLLVLDVDGESGDRTLAALVAEYGLLPLTLVQTTGRGSQWFFRRPPGSRIGNSAHKLGAGLDTRGQGGYVVAPPSVHPNGRRYAWVDDGLPVAEPPEWLLALLEPPEVVERPLVPVRPYQGATSSYAARAFEGELNGLAGAPEGCRNCTLNTAAFSLGQLVAAGELHEVEVREALRRVAVAVGLEERETVATIASGLRAGAQKPRSIPPKSAR
jgi:hypothetical protein